MKNLIKCMIFHTLFSQCT